MTVSFIITSYNIEGYIEKCIRSVIDVCKEDDEIIVVDDGSTDSTPDKIRQVLEGSGVTHQLFLLSANTFGGVGVAANQGIRHATKDTIFFVDGDDWINKGGFNASRGEHEFYGADFTFCNYLEYDESGNATRTPSDYTRWSGLTNGPLNFQRRDALLSMIAVPWRKFYKTSFLRDNKLLFDEGDFFFEDNPFHWKVTLAAKTARIVDAEICYHRFNREGQTMASVGLELCAFFTHYRTIEDLIGTRFLAHRPTLLTWLVSNIRWHLERIELDHLPEYLDALLDVTNDWSSEDWAHIKSVFSGIPVYSTLISLKGNPQNTIGDLIARLERNSAQLSDIQDDVETLKNARLVSLAYESSQKS